MVAGNLLLLSSALVLDSLLLLLFAILVIDGLDKILTWPKRPADRVAALVNGVVDFGCAALLWYLSRILSAEQAVGIIVGAYVAAAGCRMLIAPAEPLSATASSGPPTLHPDPGLRLPPHEDFARLRSETDSTAETVRGTDLMWIVTLGIVFLALHADIGHPARHRCPVRCDGWRFSNDTDICHAGCPALPATVATVDKANRANGLVDPSQ